MTDITREEVERIMALAEAVQKWRGYAGFPWNDHRLPAMDMILPRSAHESFSELIAACDPQTILALCAAALRGIEGRELDAALKEQPR